MDFPIQATSLRIVALWLRCGSLFYECLARDVIYTSGAYATMSVSVCLSVTEVHWRIIAI